MNSIRRTVAPLALAFAAFTLVPAVAQAHEMQPATHDVKQEKPHSSWIERTGEAVFHILGLDSLISR